MTPVAAGVVVVTGAGSGIGAAVREHLIADGRRVIGLDLHGDVDGDVWTCDVADPGAVQQAAQRVRDEHGGAAALVNVAGVLRPGRIADLAPDDLPRMLAVNVLGVLHCLQAFAPQLRERAPSAVVTVASNSAGVPRTGIGGYGATKAAASMLTRSFGLEEAGQGVRCNVVAPGSTRTPMLEELWGDDPQAEAGTVAGDAQQFRLGIPAGRVARASDIAEVVAFLISDAARHVHLQELYVDGGATLHG